MEQWEYKTLKVKSGGFLGGKVDTEKLQEEMNQLGREGWELVSCFDTSMGEGASREIISVFKRKKF